MSILDATSGVSYDTIADAIDGSSAGDVIRIQAGTYAEALPKITHDLTIEGVGGMPDLVGSPNDEGVLVTDADVTVNGIEFSGATGPSGDDAGIRFESGNLTVDNCWFQDNQDGMLVNPDPTATITIENSEFDDNGAGDGYTHNLYVNEVATLDIVDSYFHDALGGHEIKSRADNTIIAGTRIDDGPTAQSNYSVDLPDGGDTILTGDTIEKGPNDPNWTSIHFGGEADPVYANSSLTITDTTYINDLDPNTTTPPFVNDQAYDASGSLVLPEITGNTFYGLPSSQLLQETAYDNSSQVFLGVDPGLNSFLARSDGLALDTSHPFTVPCFTAGTRLLTPAGEVAVETLRIGDAVTTASGAARAVKWIGRRRYDAATVAGNPTIQPIRIRIGALGEGVPHRDLLVSPLHALFLAVGESSPGVLVPAAALVNEVSIVGCAEHGAVAYFHVELDSHDLLLADGAPAESFCNRDSRALFENAAECTARPPDAAAGISCVQRVEDGLVLEAIRRRLAARTGIVEPAVLPGPLRGHVEAVGDGWVEGWVIDTANPVRPVELEVSRDGMVVARLLANRYRGDLHRAGLGGGRCAFGGRFAPGPGRVTVRRLADAQELAQTA